MNKNKQKIAIKVGMSSLMLSIVIFFSIPLFFTNIICDLEFTKGCGFANTGIVGYMLLLSLPFFITGITLLVLALLPKKK